MKKFVLYIATALALFLVYIISYQVSISFLNQKVNCYHSSVADCSSNPNYSAIILSGVLIIAAGYWIGVKYLKIFTLTQILAGTILFCILVFVSQMLGYERMKSLEGITHEWNSSVGVFWGNDTYVEIINKAGAAIAALVSAALIILLPKKKKLRK